VLPNLEAGDLDGCETASDAVARVAGLLIEYDAVLDVADNLPRLSDWLLSQYVRLPDDHAALLASVSCRAILATAAALLDHRSRARANGLPALDLAYTEADGVIVVEPPPGYRLAIVRESLIERHDASAINDAIEDAATAETQAAMSPESFNWAWDDQGTTGLDRDRRKRSSPEEELRGNMQ
jgi:hypothetical protein